MITEDYVSFETAKLLKEKGFDENCTIVYNLNNRHSLIADFYGVGTFVYNSYLNKERPELITAPTLQMAMKWLRETHGIFTIVQPDFRRDCIKFDAYILPYHIDKIPNAAISMAMCEDTYEAVCDEAIKYCLEKLI